MDFSNNDSLENKLTKNPGPSESSMFLSVLPYVLTILIVPVGFFFASKSFIFSSVLGMSEVSSNVWSAVVAVVLTHVVLGAFVYKSMSSSPKSRKQD